MYILATVGEKTYKRHVIIINLSDNEALVTANILGDKYFEKNILAGKRLEDVQNITIANGSLPKPWSYTAMDVEKDTQFCINGKEKYIVPWHMEEIYYVLFILKKTGKRKYIC